ncbi:MAG: HPr(Ser) kinase/phosphatase [Neisseria sp.]|nr:HPr(Ser) kinase/phosphatase [Neisseria sp.]
MPTISVRRLYQDNQHKLQLAWAAGTAGADNRIGVEADKPVLALVGHLNFIHPNQVQVLGVAEAEYLNRLEAEGRAGEFAALFDLEMAVVVMANGLPVPSVLRDYCHTRNIPLLTSKQESPHLMDVLRIYLQRVLAVSTVKHGVFLDVYEIGVLIVGQSGLGKSELALELISRGHGLIADDAVELHRTGPEMLEGRCPAMLRDFLEVRGLGVLNIRDMFGETAIRPKKRLQLIISLVPADDDYMKQLDRLSVRTETETILNVNIPSVTLPVAVGRNLSVLVEAAVRNYILQLRGKNSTKEFLERHQSMMRDDEDYENHTD